MITTCTVRTINLYVGIQKDIRMIVETIPNFMMEGLNILKY